MGSIQPVNLGNLYDRYLVPPGKKIKLSDFDPSDTASLEKSDAVKKIFHRNKKRIQRLTHLLYAEGQHAFLGIFQSMDTGGKDRAIRKPLQRVDHNCCHVTHYKAPSEEDRRYDYLERIHEHVPPKGCIGIFHRSQYEDILVPRVKNLVPENVWRARYEQINNFEKMLSETGAKIVKIFLYISKEEQRERLIERRDNPEKQWKLSLKDIEERKHWDKYMEAYEDIFNECSTEWAKWFIVPANHQWFKDLVISEIFVKELESMALKYPSPSFDPSAVKIE